jgi:tRNA(fMet)-specific endonuclease VapC
VKYLLDTNACIALLNGHPPSVREQLKKAQAAGDQVAVPAIVAFELWYGVLKSSLREPNTRKLESFLATIVSVLPFDEEDARVAGDIRASMETQGKPIGAYDFLIAGQAMRHSMTLVTANTNEFSRVKGLSWQDWSTK